ncbi:Hypothetical predicted protein [Olea europaea subsp. europaea]|uniref:Uncharacterized protein n=1 Tax=Olea europaea subsp. europaea TaxID=158383 RepID=A0A8S0QDU8_OLEEU|nr:Hypothetical predicted protein [Olea europaea subsp. europaea]
MTTNVDGLPDMEVNQPMLSCGCEVKRRDDRAWSVRELSDFPRKPCKTPVGSPLYTKRGRKKK